MKNLLLICAAIIAVSCSNPRPDMKGAYKMLSQSIKGDSTDITNNNPQLKLYTEEYMMWTNYNPKDSSRAFGICAYHVNDNEVIESAIYSAANSTVSDSTQNYALTIEWRENGYKQSISGTANTGEKFVSTEEYETVSSAKTSPLDGAWVQTFAFYMTDKGDTVTYTGVAAYKVYYAGSFMFGNTMRDSLSVSHTNIGFGTFEMSDDNTAKENIQTSSYLNLAGQRLDVALKWNGTDEFTQTIIGENGNVSWTETYKRLGK